MADPGWEKAKDLLDKAQALSGRERDEFLDRECGGGQLRSFVESLLGGGNSPSPDGGGVSNSTTTYAPLTEKAGSRIGPYKLLQQIGEGGFGVVFMAEQMEPVRRRVALKIIKLGMDTRRVVARFEAERQALAMMDHPNIAKVFDAGATESGRPYFVMELVRGVPITEYCDANNLSAAERLDLFMPVCRAIQHAHIKGVIHRDIKPSNILVTLHDGKPVPKVIDFGIAKATDHHLTEKTLFTELRQLIGTPAYMSPEQAEMSGLDIDTRTDVYSLGVLLYELLTGTTPFPAEDLLKAGYGEMQRIIRETEPPRPSTRVSTLAQSEPRPSGNGVSGLSAESIAAKRRTEPKKLGLLLRGDIDWIVMKALEKDRTRRYETAEAFAADVQRHLSGEPVVAAPPSTAYRVRKFVKKHRGQVVGVSSVFVALLLGMAGTAWQWRVAEDALSEAQRERDRADTAADDAQWSTYSANLGFAQFAMANRAWSEARERLRQCPEEKRGWEWRFLNQRAASILAELPPAATVEFSANAASPRLLLTKGAYDNTARLWDAVTGRQIGQAMPDAAGAWFSADGKRVLTAPWARSYGDTAEIAPIRVWDVANGKILTELKYGGKEVTSVSRDLSRALAKNSNTDAQLWDVAKGKPIGAAIKHNRYILSATISADGSRVLMVSDSAAHLLDAETGNSVGEVMRCDNDSSDAVFSPDGTRVLTRLGEKTQLWDAATGKPIGEPMKLGYGIDSFFSPDGSRIVAVGDDAVRDWDASLQRPIGSAFEHDGVVDAAFSPDGRTVLTASNDGRTRLWNIATGEQIGEANYPIAESDEMNIKTAISSDGELAALRALGYVSDSTFVVSAKQVDIPERRISGEDAGLEIAAILGEGNDFQWHQSILTPDGSRRVAIEDNSTVRFVEPSSGREVAVMRPDFRPTGLAFTRDGTRLVILSGDSVLVERTEFEDGRVANKYSTSAVVWDAREPDARQADRDARAAERTPAEAVVSALLDGPLKNDELVPSLRARKDITPLQRAVAMEALRKRIAETGWKAQAAFDRIKEEQISVARVRVAAERWKPEPNAVDCLHQRVRKMLIKWAAEWKPDKGQLNGLVWGAVKAGATAETLSGALEVAQEFVTREPEDAIWRRNLGAAQYRLGRYEEALDTLAKASAVNDRDSVICAFTAMCQFKLGREQDVKASVSRLKELLKQSTSMDGIVSGNKLVFRYTESDSVGEGWFELAPNGQSFAGKWRRQGEDSWGDWSAERRTGRDLNWFEGVWVKASYGDMWLFSEGDRVRGFYGLDPIVVEALTLIETASSAQPATTTPMSQPATSQSTANFPTSQPASAPATQPAELEGGE